MTAECMRWLLRLMRLKRGDGKSFLLWFARRMYTCTEGVPQDCWKEVVTWAGMPQLLVNMTLEVEVDEVISKPMNALFYERQNGFPAGYVIRKLPLVAHAIWRPLIERLASDPLSIMTETAAVINGLSDARLRALKTKQVRIYSCAYVDCITTF